MTTTTTAPSTGAAGTAPAGAAAVPPKRNNLPTARYTMAQMRRSAGRLTAAGIAILIGTAFVAVTLLAGNVITRTTYDTIAARFADADVLVTTSGSDWRQDVEAVRGTDGVTAAEPVRSAYLNLGDGSAYAYAEGIARPQDDRLMPLELTSGKWPSERGEIAVPDGIAERLGVGVGDEIDIYRWVQTDAETGDGEEVAEPVRVVGVTEDPYDAYAVSGGAVVATAADIEEWGEEPVPGEAFEIAAVLAPSALSGDEPTQAVRDALAAAVVSDGEHAAQTVDERAREISAERTGGEDLVFLVFVLTFAAVALLVAGLVIANTFQVLVAQRTRTLALLRCIGAGRGQLYRSVLLEAAVLGVLASLGGVVVGVLLAQTALFVAPQFDIGVPLPATVTITPQVVLIPLAVGTFVTLVAALAPARNATRVAPLAALRPAETLSVRKGAGRARAVFSALATIGGFALVALGVFLGMNDAVQFGLAATVLGGAISLVGIIIGTVFWLPKVAALLGAIVARTGPASRLAAANTLRNPRRTSATATALLIGVTLIMTMTTGAAAARQTADSTLDETFPVDIMVMSGSGSVPPSAVDTIAGVDAVADVAELYSADAELPDGEYLYLQGADVEDLRATVNDAPALDGLEPGTVLLTEGQMEELDVAEGDTLDVTGTGEAVPLTVVRTDSVGLTGFVGLGDLRQIDPDAMFSQVWASLVPDVDAADALADVQQAMSDDGVMVTGPAAQRAQFEQVINVMLGIVVGLLAVAVVIAVIGVANTLSLSVIERRRESATLRAIGLGKSQLRGMLAVEGMLIAGVGAVLGIVLGLVYGWTGALTALSIMGGVSLTVPWLDLGVVLVVAIIAGLVASVAPARSALKASPVEALGAE
ncbi:ABC transporter permease [Myceligenerans pegani]|uniref:FtsX-like permease family protein n=1 Tax=Myceligenerans pegani TaxID=2776917 RepID=A0ABR9MYE0_9MICO|nr:FtsX-like permease family protein [Myceligenerans sp. TRM 65318]MBE1876403.1 FtsX-like permease family protein [Myceligenerans sp. TRM 65318]MBE3018674.1 FtsX-like permease family protein [Myceligenerans sp. TRM 65318]